jgi:hypothetical protein
VNLDSQDKPSGHAPDAAVGQEPLAGGSHSAAAFYRRRNIFYLALIILILAAGLPQLLIPALRQRLQERSVVLRESLSGASGKPKGVTAQVGENTVPFPKEYERVVQPLPQLPPQIFNQDHVYRPVPAEPGAQRRRASSKKTESGSENTKEAAASQDADTGQSEPEFLQGKMEQEAYDILIQTNSVAAGLIRPGNALGRFSGWAAAKIDEDTYLVRLTLVKDGTDVPYIWQVRIGAKQNAPLNFNARSLPKP